MVVLAYIFIFIAGALIGSFLNLVSDRIVNGKPILVGRSECDHCHTKLEPKNLIPLFSFIFQRGKCSYCSEKLNYYYPISEILTGFLFVFITYWTNVLNNLETFVLISFVYLAIVFCFYVILFLADAKYMLVPNKIVYGAIIFVFGFLIINFAVSLYQLRVNLLADDFGQYLYQAGYWHQNLYAGLKGFGYLLLSTLGIALFFKALIWITRGKGMGQGDVPLAALVGLFNGFPFNLLAIFLAFVIGAVYSLVLVATKKKGMKSVIPFGPFLLLASFLAFAWGDLIFEWYFNLF